MKITFWGAAQTVTGSRHLLQFDGNRQVLLDCGMFQGRGQDTDELNRHLGFNPVGVNAVILSHAHIDHAGALPRLVSEGFDGIIYCTPATFDLCRILLYDSAHIQESDLKYVNQRRRKRGEPLLEPIYSTFDVDHTLSLMRPVAYHEEVSIFPDVKFHFTDNGHILGSACVHVDWKENGEWRNLTFTGDIGRPKDRILKEPEPFRQPEILLCESTYGNRLHPAYPDLEADLLRIVTETCVEKRGKLIIPAFAVDRTQELVYALDRMETAGKLPNINVYVDSPLAVEATSIMRHHQEDYNAELQAYLKSDKEHDAFMFRNLKYITKVDDSKAINTSSEPCVIISASGMAEAGRIKHHIANNIGNPNNTILMVGYCTPDSLGGRLKEGAEIVRIFGEDHPVKARIESLEGYSAHADYEEMATFLSCTDPDKISQFFLVHGELEVQQEYKQFLKHKGYHHIFIPEKGQTFEILPRS